MALTIKERQVLGAVADGLPLVSRPYAELGARLGLEEEELIAVLRRLRERGVVRRLGLIVRHHELGYHANGMVVWDIPDDAVAAIGNRMGAAPFVTLCYRRPRRMPDWPYNLYSMIHGRDRDDVRALVGQLATELGLEAMAHEILFSRRRFRQRGARYGAAVERKTV